MPIPKPLQNKGQGMRAHFQIGDIKAALGLLTRLPVTVDAHTARARGADIAWAFPLVGALVGALAGLVALLLAGLGHGPMVQATGALITQVFVTGALHEDGLADTADGFWGGYTAERRLEIMKDSHIGTNGVLALVFSVLLRWSLLTLLCAAGPVFWPLIAIGALSRSPMVALMGWMPQARRSGLSVSVGQPQKQVIWMAFAVAGAIGLLLLGWGFLPMAIVIALVSVSLAALANAKIGGQTGDVLGTCQQLTEIAFLLMLTANL